MIGADVPGFLFVCFGCGVFVCGSGGVSFFGGDGVYVCVSACDGGGVVSTCDGGVAGVLVGCGDSCGDDYVGFFFFLGVIFFLSGFVGCFGGESCV